MLFCGKKKGYTRYRTPLNIGILLFHPYPEDKKTLKCSKNNNGEIKLRMAS